MTKNNKPTTNTVQQNPIIVQSANMDKDCTMEECRSFLLYNFEKNDEVKDSWEKSFDLRQTMLRREGEEMENILHSWPIIGKPFGSELVSINYLMFL